MLPWFVRTGDTRFADTLIPREESAVKADRQSADCSIPVARVAREFPHTTGMLGYPTMQFSDRAAGRTTPRQKGDSGMDGATVYTHLLWEHGLVGHEPRQWGVKIACLTQSGMDGK
jgi:hypothetical protein